MPIALEEKYRPVGMVTSRNIGNEIFLMHRATQTTYSLNETSSFIWRLLNGDASVCDICDAVAGRYDITSDESTASVIDLLETFLREGLIVRSPDHA